MDDTPVLTKCLELLDTNIGIANSVDLALAIDCFVAAKYSSCGLYTSLEAAMERLYMQASE